MTISEPVKRQNTGPPRHDPDRARPPGCAGVEHLLLSAVLCLLVVLSGCSTAPAGAGRGVVRDRPAPPAAAGALAEAPESDDLRPKDGPLVPLTTAAEDGTAGPQLPVRGTDEEAAVPAAEPRPTYSLSAEMIKGLDAPDEMISVKLNFDAAPLNLIVEQFAVDLNFQFFIDPKSSGSVSLRMDTEMPIRDVWELFEHILWISGNYATRNKGFLDILPFTKMSRERRVLTGFPPMPNVHVDMIHLRHTAPAKIIAQIKPFMTDGATATPLDHLNSILLVEAPPNIPKLRELIRRLDILGESNWPTISIRCIHVDVELILDELKTIMPTIGFPISSSEKSDGHTAKVVTLNRLQVIIASAPTVGVLDEIRRWVEVLDLEESGEQEKIYFYRVKNSTPEDLNNAIKVFFNASSTMGATASATTTSSTTGGRSRTTTRTTATRRGAAARDKISTIFDVPVTMFVEPKNSQLVIRTTPRAYAMIRALLLRLDIPPRQVLIQMTIVEMTLSKSTDAGFTYSYDALKKSNIKVSLLEVADQPGIFTATFVSSAAALATVKAVARNGNTKVLFAPQIMTINDKQASINVGERVPVVTRETGTVSSSDTDNVVRTFQYIDTGIILTVTPQITSSNMVVMELKQEISDAIFSDDRENPTIKTSIIESNLIVQSGHTMLLGGLIQTKTEKTFTGIPFLKDIPYLGKLFGASFNSKRRTELLLLITPMVIDRETDLDKIKRRYRRALRAAKQEFRFE